MKNIPRPETGHYINLKRLSNLAFTRIEDLCEEMDWPPLEKTADPTHVILLIERLENCKDDEHLFPKGKYATIQHLRQIFEDDFYNSISGLSILK